MSLRLSFGIGLALGLVVIFSCLRADTAPPPVAPGYHNVPIKNGDHTAYIQVRDTNDPFAHLKQTDDAQGNAFSLNRTSTLSHQNYDLGAAATATPAAVKDQSQTSGFQTRGYFANHPAAATTWKAYQTDTTEAYVGLKSADYDKTFTTARADIDQKTAGGANSTSEYAGKSAQLGGHEVKVFASSLGTQTYAGREASLIKKDLAQMNDGMEGLKDLPNRTLTIDEVRALINHGIKPNTEEKAPEPTKALNDPDYTPDAAPALLRDAPLNDSRLKTFNDDLIPPPGMMAHPEAAEALPQ